MKKLAIAMMLGIAAMSASAQVNYKMQVACNPQDVKTYNTNRLRSSFLMEKVMVPDQINVTYSMYDRLIFGGAVPATKELVLETIDPLKAKYFLERRELGVINIGGEGIVTVDGKDSSEVWGGFRVGNRAKVTMLEDTDNQIKASHNGFGKKGVHTRTFRMDMKSFTIIDDVSSNNQAISYIHLAPEIEVKSVTHEKIVTNRGIIHIRNAQSVKTMDEKISTAYNLFHSIKTIKILFTKEMEYMIESNLKQQ